MKKLSSISLALFYLTLSVGVVKSTHYCMGRVFDVDYFNASEEPCMPDMKDMSCCSSEIELIIIEDDQSQSHFNLTEKQLVELQTLPELPDLSALMIDVEESEPGEVYDLPPPPLIPLYKLHCTYTYYG